MYVYWNHEDNNIILNEQFGFRKLHSTIHQVERIIKLISSNKSQRKSAGIVFLDFEKVFNSIWHDGLVYKVNMFGYSVYLQKIIQNFLNEPPTNIVNVENEFSSQRPIPAALPQGSVLSSILYSIIISDFKTLREQSAALYAHDTTIITTGKVSIAIIKKMKKGMLHTEKYFSKWKRHLL